MTTAPPIRCEWYLEETLEGAASFGGNAQSGESEKVVHGVHVVLEVFDQEAAFELSSEAGEEH